jgi:hypothetical protein
MAEIAFPFQSGAGAQVTESLWSMMARVFAQTGVVKGALGELAVTASGSDMTVSVASGRAVIQGEFYQSDATQTKTIAPADPSNPRIDRVILRLDWTAKSITLVILTGTPAANPQPPALTQNDILSGASQPMWEISLAQVYVPAGATSIQASNVTDERVFTGYALSSSAIPNTIAVRDQNGIVQQNIPRQFSTNGYIQLPSGLIIQWLEYDPSSPSTLTTGTHNQWEVNWPIPFPNACLSHVGSQIYGNTSNGPVTTTFESASKTGLTITSIYYGSNSVTNNLRFRILAVGY